MRTSRSARAAVAVLAALAAAPLLTGCGGGGSSDAGRDPSAPSAPSASSSPSSSPSGGGGSGGGATGQDAVCREVVAGIDAFNAGDFDQTVDHFQAAVPLARRAAGRDGSRTSRLLLRAVRYYADLAPEDYPAASRGSAAFQRYKAVTLGLCVQPGAEPSPGSPPSSPGVVTA